MNDFIQDNTTKRGGEVLGRLGAMVCALLLVGCGANQNSIFRTYSVAGKQQGDVTVALIDAKQRAIISQKTPRSGGQTIVCSEPSPDAFTVLSSAFSASGTFGTPQTEAAGAFASKLNESGAKIGLRTQTITAMRDLMFYLCQYYMAGAVTDTHVQAAMQRQGKLLTAFVAIEQLTGVATPAIVTIKADTGEISVSPTLPGTVGRNGAADSEKEQGDKTENKPEVPETQENQPNAEKESENKTGDSGQYGTTAGLNGTRSGLGSARLNAATKAAPQISPPEETKEDPLKSQLEARREAAEYEPGKQHVSISFNNNGFDSGQMWLVAATEAEKKKAEEAAAKKKAEEAAAKKKAAEEAAAKKKAAEAAGESDSNRPGGGGFTVYASNAAPEVARAVVEIVRMVFEDDEIKTTCLVKLINNEIKDDFVRKVCGLSLIPEVTKRVAGLKSILPDDEIQLLNDELQNSLRQFFQTKPSDFPEGGDGN